jgi:hypothetical protein
MLRGLDRFLYLAATTLSGYQSLGEEYSGLVPVVAPADRRHRLRTPSLLRRFLLIFLQTLGPRLLAVAVARLEKRLNDDNSRLGRNL